MIGLFIPCLVDQFFPEVGEAVVDLLEARGLEVDYPEGQTCCGLPFYNMGYWESAAHPARRFIELFESYEAVVTPSSSCAAMIRHFNANIFEKDPPLRARAEALGAKTHELTSFLVNELGVTHLGAQFEGSVACHRSCHLREIEAGGEAEALIRAVKGVKFTDLPRTEVCCGFGGSFAVKFPVLSGAMGTTKCETIEQCKADLVVTTDAGCMMQINGLLHRRGGGPRVRHIAELLAGKLSPVKEPTC